MMHSDIFAGWRTVHHCITYTHVMHIR